MRIDKTVCDPVGLRSPLHPKIIVLVPFYCETACNPKPIMYQNFEGTKLKVGSKAQMFFSFHIFISTLSIVLKSYFSCSLDIVMS